MCGIVGYAGSSPSGTGALESLLEGLGQLEYRGYDSAGIAVLAGGDLHARKRAGKLANLLSELEASPVPSSVTGIGHTRWATHGGPTDQNAHPHLAAGGRLALIHNGIIENYASLREELAGKGHTFDTETDTEVVAALLGDAYAQIPAQVENSERLTRAMRKACLELEGTFTLVALHADHPGLIVAARRNSPLVVGLGNGENFLASDVSAFFRSTRRAIELGQDQIVTMTAEEVVITDFAGEPALGREFDVDWDAGAIDKGGYAAYMAKEIDEQPAAVAQTLLGRLDGHGRIGLTELDISDESLRAIERVIIVACGTAAHGGQVAKYAIEEWAAIPVDVELAHEFRYRSPILSERTLVVAISQSGETMDTLMAVRYAKEHGAKVIAICNTVYSSIARESDAVLYTRAGPEVAVASTKAFLAQLTANYLLALHLSQVRKTMTSDVATLIGKALGGMPAKIQQVLDQAESVRNLAKQMTDVRSVLFLGKHVGFPIALEGALKLKELAYIHAEGFAAGELKHGPIALIHPGQIAIVIVPSRVHASVLHAKVISTIQEIQARGATVIAISVKGDGLTPDMADKVIEVPPAPELLAPLLTTVPLQIFAAEMAASLGLNIDQPRNLAKSVTVE